MLMMCSPSNDPITRSRYLKKRKGVLVFAPGGWGSPPDPLEQRGKRDSRKTNEKTLDKQDVVPLNSGGGKPQIKNPWGDDQT